MSIYMIMTFIQKICNIFNAPNLYHVSLSKRIWRYKYDNRRRKYLYFTVRLCIRRDDSTLLFSV
jgi:hypothetical protein